MCIHRERGECPKISVVKTSTLTFSRRLCCRIRNRSWFWLFGALLNVIVEGRGSSVPSRVTQTDPANLWYRGLLWFCFLIWKQQFQEKVHQAVSFSGVPYGSRVVCIWPSDVSWSAIVTVDQYDYFGSALGGGSVSWLSFISLTCGSNTSNPASNARRIANSLCLV